MFSLLQFKDIRNVTNLERLADFLQKVTGIQKGKDPEETIDRAIALIKTSKNTDVRLKHDLAHTKIMEEVDMTTNETEQEIRDWIVRKFNGESSTKTWGEIEFANIGKLDMLKNREYFKKKIVDYSEEYDGEWDDTESDFENGIAYDDIETFIDTLPVTDYLDIYDPAELEPVIDGDQWEKDDEDEEDDEELEECSRTISESFNPHEIMEALSRQARIKLRNAMRRNKAKIAVKRRMALKRRSTADVLKRRAHKLAIKMLKKKFAHKAIADMSMADKERVEKLLQAKKSLVDRLTIKMIPVVRKIEQQRFAPKQD